MWRLFALWMIYAIWEVAPQESVGCFQDGSPFILSGMIYRHRSNMTVDWCLNECLRQRGDAFAGLQAGYACLCGNNSNHTKYGSQLPDSECRIKCSGDRSHTCGGAGHPHIYRDVNECAEDHDLCSIDKFQCINTPGSYHCECTSGYILNQGSCSDVNECIDDPALCSMDNFECINTPGSYHCECKPGYTMIQGSCSDIDECREGSHQCDHTCTNLPGGYQCSCHDGYRPDDEQGASCTDVDECSEGLHQCDHTCINTPGIYQCVCEKGYHLEQDLHTCSNVQVSDLLQQIAGLKRLTTGLIVGVAVMSLAFTTCLVILLCVCIRLKRDDKTDTRTSASLQDIPTVAPCYEDVTNYNPPEGSAHYEELQEFHLEESTYQTVTSSVLTS